MVMAETRQKAAWQHTSHVMALLAEIHRDKEGCSRPFEPADFDPYAEPSAPAELPAGEKLPVTVLKPIFVDPRR